MEVNEKEEYLNQEYENILLNLKIISLLGENEKIYTNADIISTQNDKSLIPESFMRWWTSENRVSNIDRIQDIINNAGKIINENKIETPEYTRRFFNELNNSLKGLRSLKKTYRADTVALAKIETVIDIIKGLIKEVSTKIQHGGLIEGILESDDD